MNLKVDTHWNSDWNGYEVGYPDVLVVGLYSLAINPEIYFYVDMETLDILEAWAINEDCECNL